MNLQPTLEDELVLLRPLSENDFESLFEVARDPLIWEQHPCTDRFRKEVYSDFFADSLQSKGALIVKDKSNREVIGSSRYEPVDNMATAIEIGWSFLARKYWGGKYNRAVKKLMIDYAFQYVDEVIFYIGKTNIRSQRAVEKIGAVRMIDSKYQHLIKDVKDDLTFRINRRDWKG